MSDKPKPTKSGWIINPETSYYKQVTAWQNETIASRDARIEQLIEALKEAEEDTKRIEWLGEGRRGYHIVQWLDPGTSLGLDSNYGSNCTGKELRESIDKIRKATDKIRQLIGECDETE